MTKFGIDALDKLPSDSKRRRLFSFLDTWGNDKSLFTEMLEAKFGEYSPKEIPVPKTIQNVDAFSHRWDLDLFYKCMKRYLDSSPTEDSGSETLYVGDIDTFIPFCGHFLFIDEKTTLNGVKLTQLKSYLQFANKHDVTIWCLIGATQDEGKNLDLNENYRLCVIKSLGRYELFKGSLKDILDYFHMWLDECYGNQNKDAFPYSDIANQMTDDIQNEDKFEDLSFEVLLNQRMRDIE